MGPQPGDGHGAIVDGIFRVSRSARLTRSAPGGYPRTRLLEHNHVRIEQAVVIDSRRSPGPGGASDAQLSTNGSEYVLDPNRQIANSSAAGVKHRVGDC